jgi:hypothetical protein
VHGLQLLHNETNASTRSRRNWIDPAQAQCSESQTW